MEQQQKLQQQFSLLDKLSSGKKRKYQMEKVYRFIICKKATQRQTWSSQKTSKNILKICLLPNLRKISLTKKIQELKETPNEKGCHHYNIGNGVLLALPPPQPSPSTSTKGGQSSRLKKIFLAILIKFLSLSLSSTTQLISVHSTEQQQQHPKWDEESDSEVCAV